MFYHAHAYFKRYYYYYYYYYVKPRDYDFNNTDGKLYIPPFRYYYSANPTNIKSAEKCSFIITIRGFHCHVMSTANSMKV